VTIVAMEKAIVITYSGCVFVALVIQHANCNFSAYYYYIVMFGLYRRWGKFERKIVFRFSLQRSVYIWNISNS